MLCHPSKNPSRTICLLRKTSENNLQTSKFHFLDNNAWIMQDSGLFSLVSFIHHLYAHLPSSNSKFSREQMEWSHPVNSSRSNSLQDYVWLWPDWQKVRTGRNEHVDTKLTHSFIWHVQWVQAPSNCAVRRTKASFCTWRDAEICLFEQFARKKS